MSKERELLEETLVVLEMVHMDECDLYFAIEELLAKPEQEQEPFAWCIESKNSADWCFAADRSGVIGNSKFLDENCNRSDPFPLYTSPPKRGGITPREGLTEYKKGYARAELDLKRKPLSEEVVREFADGDYFICNDAFIKGVRWTEKQHKIGENDE